MYNLFAFTYSEVHIRTLWFRLLAKQYGDSIRSSKVQQHIFRNYYIHIKLSNLNYIYIHFHLLQHLFLLYFQYMFWVWFVEYTFIRSIFQAQTYFFSFFKAVLMCWFNLSRTFCFEVFYQIFIMNKMLRTVFLLGGEDVFTFWVLFNFFLFV